MLVILQDLRQSYSGVQPVALGKRHEFLNHSLAPWIPREDSVDYLCPGARIALVLIGEGKAYFDGRLLPGAEALEEARIRLIGLYVKEDLALISGTASATALATLALYSLLGTTEAADVITVTVLEASKEPTQAFDGRVIRAHPHPQQSETTTDTCDVPADSKVINYCWNARIQDALSLYCMPQLHGAAGKTLLDARRTLEIEINPCCDNSIIWSELGEGDVISAYNPDSPYVGIGVDGTYTAATCPVKMSERRNNRMINETLSDDSWFLIKNLSLNSGLMIPQYTQMGLLDNMGVLSIPSTIDNASTCDDQEDYVAMSYNVVKRSV